MIENHAMRLPVQIGESACCRGLPAHLGMTAVDTNNLDCPLKQMPFAAELNGRERTLARRCISRFPIDQARRLKPLPRIGAPPNRLQTS